MRMKMVCDDRTLRDVANEFLALKKAQKVRERTLSDYKKYIDKFLAQSQNTLDVDVLKIEILEYFADIPKNICLQRLKICAAIIRSKSFRTKCTLWAETKPQTSTSWQPC